MIEKEEWKSVLDLVTNAKQVVSSVQDAARKVSEYAKFGNKNDFPGKLALEEEGIMFNAY